MHWAAASRLLGRGGCVKGALAALEMQRGAPLNRTLWHKHSHTQGTHALTRAAVRASGFILWILFFSLPLQAISPNPILLK